MDSTEAVPKDKETILKPKKERKQLTDEARAALALRMRAINDKRILDAAEKIKKEKPPIPVPVPVEVPKSEKKKRVIKVIELSDSETDDVEEVIAIRKTKPVPKQKEYLEETPVRKPRITKPRTPKEPQIAPPQIIEPPRGRFL